MEGGLRLRQQWGPQVGHARTFQTGFKVFMVSSTRCYQGGRGVMYTTSTPIYPLIHRSTTTYLGYNGKTSLVNGAMCVWCCYRVSRGAGTGGQVRVRVGQAGGTTQKRGYRGDALRVSCVRGWPMGRVLVLRGGGLGGLYGGS